LIFAVWLVALVAQAQLSLSLVWALLDGARHGAAACACTVWLTPRWGWTPVAAAGLAGVLLDLDHALAARSIDPMAMMGLGVRPPTHSLLFGALVGLVAWPLLGRAAGYAVTAGVAVHLFEDGLEWPGVPLLLPLWSEQHVLVSVPLALLATVALMGLSLWLGRSADRRPPGPSRAKDRLL
jgi:hypothetical protein